MEISKRLARLRAVFVFHNKKHHVAGQQILLSFRGKKNIQETSKTKVIKQQGEDKKVPYDKINHTNTHTYIDTHMPTNTHIYTCTYTHTRIHIYTHIHVHTHTHPVYMTLFHMINKHRFERETKLFFFFIIVASLLLSLH